LKDTIRREIEAFVSLYQERHGTETRWREPLVGFASAADPLFVQLKTVVSPSHSLPEDLLPGARTIIAFFIPFERFVAESNIEGMPASREWAKAYIQTNELIAAVCQHMKGLMESEGHSVVVTPPTHNFDTEKLVSDWSHRHVGFAAGLGSFGLNNMLITRQGCCGRLGSFLTTLDVAPDCRAAAEACLHLAGRSCARCAERCVNGALSARGFDRKLCFAQCLENGVAFQEMGRADVCGKCVVGLPCSFTNPVDRV
jgi:epoxyqueuosine reductase QueG